MARAEWLRMAGQVVAYGAFAVVVGYFATEPVYRYVDDGEAVVKLTLAHYGQRLGECRRRSEEELADMPPNMRAPMECPRERAPVTVELDMDDERIETVRAAPTGLSRDGMSYVYQTFRVPTGSHRFTVRLRDDPDVEGFNYEAQRAFDLDGGDVLVIEFDSNAGFVFRGGRDPGGETG